MSKQTDHTRPITVVDRSIDPADLLWTLHPRSDLCGTRRCRRSPSESGRHRARGGTIAVVRGNRSRRHASDRRHRLGIRHRKPGPATVHLHREQRVTVAVTSRRFARARRRPSACPEPASLSTWPMPRRLFRPTWAPPRGVNGPDASRQCDPILRWRLFSPTATSPCAVLIDRCRHVFPTSVGARDDTASLWLDLAEDQLRLDRLIRNGCSATFFPWPSAIPREARKRRHSHPSLTLRPAWAGASTIVHGPWIAIEAAMVAGSKQLGEVTWRISVHSRSQAASSRAKS
jgi:hypothetical protein